MDSMQEVKNLLDAQNVAWETFRKTNDERLAAIEKGQTTADYDAKLAKINDELATQAKELKAVTLAAQRPAGGASGLSDEQAEHKAAFADFVRKGTPISRDLERKAMNSTSDVEGGVLVPKAMDAEIDRIVPTISAMARLARTITIGTRSYQRRVKTAGMSMRRVAEGGTGGETTEPTYASLEFVAHPAEIEPWVFNETLEDADIDLAADLTMEAAIGFAEGAASEYIQGNGVGKAWGITSYTNVANSAYTWGKVGYMPSGKSAAFASVAPADYFVNLQHALKSQYRNGAVWLMSDSTLALCRQFKDASGSYYLWNPDPTAGPAGRFLGSPVEIDDNFPTVAANSYSLAYGNFQRGYMIVNRTGTTLIRDNITAKGTTKFNFRRRFGGGIYNFEAIKLMKFATS
ncbi:MAG: phage major capsid protein [Phycisphaerales bacterium]|nr:phage major capsid protein [Phycisphaerales bacterium]